MASLFTVVFRSSRLDLTPQDYRGGRAENTDVQPGRAASEKARRLLTDEALARGRCRLSNHVVGYRPGLPKNRYPADSAYSCQP
jgi:hypothetical protein